MMRKVYTILMSALMLHMLSGCFGEEQQDLKDWMKEETSQMPRTIDPLPQIQPYEPAEYNVDTAAVLDPFKPAKITPDTPPSGGGVDAPDFPARDVRNNPLERIPLEMFKMIGYLEVEGMPIGVVQADKMIRQIKVRDYIGFDFGIVTMINEHEIKVEEKIMSADESWFVRENTLMLQGQEEKK